MKYKEEKFIQKIEKKFKKIFNLIEKLQEERFNDELERLLLEHKSKEKYFLVMPDGSKYSVNDPVDFNKLHKGSAVFSEKDLRGFSAKNMNSVSISFGCLDKNELEKGCIVDVGKLKDVYRDEFGYIFQVNKNYKEYSDMWNTYKNKEVPKITREQQETATTGLKNNIPEEIEKIKQQRLEAWDVAICWFKIKTISIMLFLIVLAIYFLII